MIKYNLPTFHADNKNQGNVIFIILIAVALFGALSFAVTDAFQGSNTSRITKQKAKAAATAIIKYGTDVEQALSRMKMLNDCSDDQISFERAPFDGSDSHYVNANAPVNYSCHVFHPSGGGAVNIPPDENSLDGVNTADADYGDHVFIFACVQGVGLSETEFGSCNGGSDDSEFGELLIMTPYVDYEVCKAINDALGADQEPAHDVGAIWSDSYKFDGELRTTTVAVGPGASIQPSAACIEGDVNPAVGTYHFYNVVLAR